MVVYSLIFSIVNGIFKMMRILQEATKADFLLMKCSCLHYYAKVLSSDGFDPRRTSSRSIFKKTYRDLC